jgi:hypothetical protein
VLVKLSVVHPILPLYFIPRQICVKDVVKYVDGFVSILLSNH